MDPRPLIQDLAIEQRQASVAPARVAAIFKAVIDSIDEFTGSVRKEFSDIRQRFDNHVTALSEAHPNLFDLIIEQTKQYSDNLKKQIDARISDLHKSDLKRDEIIGTIQKDITDLDKSISEISSDILLIEGKVNDKISESQKPISQQIQVIESKNTSISDRLDSIAERLGDTIQAVENPIDILLQSAGFEIIESGQKYALNGISDLTRSEALDIYQYGPMRITEPNWGAYRLRTILPYREGPGSFSTNFQPSLYLALSGCSALETLVFPQCLGWEGPGGQQTIGSGTIPGSVRKIIGQINAYKWNFDKFSFSGCDDLSEIRISNGTSNSRTFAFANLPSLSIDSIRFAIDNQSPISDSSHSIIVHPDVFSRLSDPDNYPEYFDLVLYAIESKNITFATS